jgi:hypothetical protein
MQRIRETINTVAIMAAVLAGVALLSGALTAASAGGGYWGG